MDIRVETIRAHGVVGTGSCSPIDECYSDAELVELLDQRGVTTPIGAVREAVRIHQAWVDQLGEVTSA